MSNYYVRLGPEHGGFGYVTNYERIVATAMSTHLEIARLKKSIEPVEAEVVFREYDRIPKSNQKWKKVGGVRSGIHYGEFCVVPAKGEKLVKGTWMPAANGIVFGCPFCGEPVVTEGRYWPWQYQSLYCGTNYNDDGAVVNGCGKHLFIAVQGVYEAQDPFKTTAKNKRRRKSQRP